MRGLPVFFALVACTPAPEADAEDDAQIEIVAQAEEPSSNLSLRDAISVAFPSSRPLRDADGIEWTFANHRLVKLSNGYALVSEGRASDETVNHSTSGRLDVFYLSDPESGLSVRRRYPEAVHVGSIGAIGEWAVSDKFISNPVIYASGGFTGQGMTEGCTVLTELTDAGPRTIAVIPDYYGGTSFDGKETEIEGKIGQIVKGKSFTVSYSGSETSRLHYEWNGSAFTTSGSPILSHCGFD